MSSLSYKLFEVFTIIYFDHYGLVRYKRGNKGPRRERSKHQDQEKTEKKGFGFVWFASARHCAWQVGRVDGLGAGLGGGLAVLD